MKQKNYFFLTWLALLFAFALGGGGAARAQSAVAVGSQVTSEDGITSGRAYILKTGADRYITDNGTNYDVPNAANSATEASVYYLISNGNGTWKIKNYYTGNCWGVPVYNANLASVEESSAGAWSLNFSGGIAYPSAPDAESTVRGIDRSSGKVLGYTTGTNDNHKVYIYEVAASSTVSTELTSGVASVAEASIGDATNAVSTGQWYTMYNRGRNGYLYENVSEHILYNQAAAPSGSASDVASFLVCLTSGDDGKFYLKNGYGNRLGTIESSTAAPMVSLNDAAQFTVATINSTDGHFYVRGTNDVVLDCNGNGETVVGYGTSLPSNTGGNNDWAFYPVSFVFSPSVSQVFTINNTNSNRGALTYDPDVNTTWVWSSGKSEATAFNSSSDNCRWVFVPTGTDGQYYIYNIGADRFAVPTTGGSYGGRSWAFSTTPEAVYFQLQSNGTIKIFSVTGNYVMSVSNNYVGPIINYNDAGAEMTVTNTAATSPVNFYTVSFSGVPSGETVTATYDDWAGLAGGSIFAAPSAGIASSDISATNIANYDYSVSVDNDAHTVSVTYTPQGVAFTFEDGSSNGVNVAVNGGTAAAYYVMGSGTNVTSITTGGSNYVTYTLNGVEYQGNNNPALIAALSALTESATLTVTTATGDITVTDVNGTALNTSTAYIIKNVGNSFSMWTDGSHIAGYSNSWAESYRYGVEGAGSLITIKNLWNNKYLASNDISNGADKIFPTATTADGALVLKAVAGSTTNGFALTPAGSNHLNFFGGSAGANLGYWAGSSATNEYNTWQFVPARFVQFVDGTGTAVNVNGTIGGNSFTNLSDINFPIGDQWTALSVSGSSYATFQIGSNVYYGANNPALLAALSNLSADATVTVTTVSGDITLTDVNGVALDPDTQYFLKVNRDNAPYIQTLSEGQLKPQAYHWNKDYLYKVAGAGALVSLQSVQTGLYVGSNDVSNGANKVAATYAAGNALVFKGTDLGGETPNNTFTLAAYTNGATPMNLSNTGGVGNNLGFWYSANTDGSTFTFVPARELTFVDTEGNAVAMTGTVNGESFSGINVVCYPTSSDGTWTAISPSGVSSPYVVTYTIGGTTYDDRNMVSLLAALNALTADATVTVQYSGAITVNDINGNALQESRNYYIKLPGRGEYYLRQNSTSKVRPMVYAGTANQLYQVKGWSNYLAINLPYEGTDYYLGVNFGAASALNAGTGKVSSTNTASQILRFKAEAQDIEGLSYTYSLEAACGTTDIKSTYFSNHSGVGENMGFYKQGGPTDGGSYFQFVPAVHVTVQSTASAALPVTVDGLTFNDGTFYKPVDHNLSTFQACGISLGSTTTATITVGETSNNYTGVDNILAAINALTADATVSLAAHTVTFTDAVRDTTMKSFTMIEGSAVSEVTLNEDATNFIATFTLDGTVYDARYRTDFYNALAAKTTDANVAVHYATGAFSTLDSRGTALADGGYYFLELVGRNTSTAEYFASLDGNYVKPTTSFDVSEYADNSTLVQVKGGSAGSNSLDYLRLAVPSKQDNFFGTDLTTLYQSSPYENIVTSPNSEIGKVYATSTLSRFITFRSDAKDASTYKYGLQVTGSNNGSKVETYMSNIYGKDYRIGFYNNLTDDGTYLQFVPAIKVSFVDINGIPVKVNVNDEEHANGVVRVPYGHELHTFTPPIRLATYQIGSDMGLSSQDVIERVATFTEDTQIQCNSFYRLQFQNESGTVINSSIHSGSVVLASASEHSVGMGCILTNIILDGYTDLNYTYVLDGEEYDIIGLYSALLALDVAQNELVVVTVKENTPAIITVNDINGNPLVAGNDYYVVFPGRNNYYFGSNGTGKTNYSLKLNSSCSYVAPEGNPRLFKVEGNGKYLRLIASRNNMTLSPITAANGGTNVFYVASEDVTNGYDKVKLMNDVDYALVFRAEAFTNYPNCYALRVSNHNGTVETYLSNFSGTAYNNMGFKGTADADAYLQFVPYSSGLTLNFKTADGSADLPVTMHRNNSDNGTTAVLSTAASTYTFSNPSSTTDLTNIQEGRYFYFNASGVSLNVVKYRYDGADYTNWADVISAGASVGGTVEVWLTTDGLTTLYDINGNPVVEGKTYRLRRYQTRSLQSAGNDATVKSVTTSTSNGSQFWKATFTGNYMTLTCNDQDLYASGSTAYVGTGTPVNFSVAEVDRVNHFYFFGTNDVNSTYTHMADAGSTDNDFGFHTGANAAGAKFAFVPAGGVSDVYNNDLVAERTYRIEMPAKVGQTQFPAGKPVTLTLTSPSSNNSETETKAMAASVEQYNTYYWLPDTYTGLNYMYNEKQVWEVEPVADTEAGYLIKSANGYLKVASYDNGAAVTVNAAQGEASTFYGIAAQYDGLTSLYGLYTFNPSAESPTSLYLCVQGSGTMYVTQSPKQTDTRWYADCVFRFTPVKSQSLATAYTNGNVLSKGFDCYGPGKTANGLVWNSSTQKYDESLSCIIETHDMFRGLGDKNDSIVGYHLPDPIYLAYDYGTDAYMETVDFTAPSLIGYKGTITTTTRVDGYKEFTGYELKNYPILASPAPTVVNGVYVFDPNTNWYMVVIRDCDEKLLINNELKAGQQLNDLENPFVDKYLFCFVGDSINGYLVYNKARGAGHFMGPKDAQARWNQAQNVTWIEDATTTDEKRNKSRILFQTLQHDHSGHISFVDRYTGFNLDRWNTYVVYWHGRPIKGGNDYADNSAGSHITTDYQKTQLGVIPNSFYRGGNRLEARTMGFPSVATTYARLLQNAIESGYLASLVGYVGLFRSEADIQARYDVYIARVATAAMNAGLTDAQYHAELTAAYNDFFNWLKGEDTPGTLNGVEFLRRRYFYLKSAATDGYLAVTSGTEGASSYSLTTTNTPQTVPGAVWKFDEDAVINESYGSELGSTHRLRNVFWNATLKTLNPADGQSTATLTLDDSNFASIDVYNDMNQMENPGQFVLRTSGISATPYLTEADTCLALVDGVLVAHQGRVGGGQRRWYLVPVMTESPSSPDNWADLENQVEEFTTVTIPDGTNWINGTTIGDSRADDLVFTTYCNPDRAVAFPHNSNFYAFRADREVGSEAIFLEQLDDLSGQTIPAGMGVVMLAPNGATIPFLPVASANVTNTSSMLESAGSELADNIVTSGNYVFVYKKKNSDYVLKFYKVGSSGVKLGYHRAYLPSSELSYAVRGLSNIGISMLFDDGTVTNLRMPLTDTDEDDDLFGSSSDGNGNAYDMQGRRVTDPTQPGVYIINGRKVYVK